MKKLVCLLIAAGMLACCAGCGKPAEEIAYNSKYQVVAEAFDWGAASTRAIVKLEGEIVSSKLCGFRVIESNKNGDVGEREITKIYLCDEKGNEINASSRYIAIEMRADPSHGTLFYYDTSQYYNVWDEEYRLAITPVDAESEVLKSLSVDPKYTNRITPQADLFGMSEFVYDDITMDYALYSPAGSGEKRPLVVWLHGQGEGGHDASISLLGNKVTALAGDDIQGILGGAYVLAPQCPTYWPDNTAESKYYGMRADGTSYWQEPLKALIDKTVSENGDIDPERIYIGGCSMGGYMTMLMVKSFPDFFAAAFPVCECYDTEFISYEEAENMAKTPLWFTYCAQDHVVPPQIFSAAAIDMLKNAGAGNLHASIFDDVHDTTGEYVNKDGTPYTYDNHWSWIYVLNNECYDGDLNLWEWMSMQNR
jgi:dienelactone hydrolase